jgi:isoquinoline 1-oxidoreductase alpha subunit
MLKLEINGQSRELDIDPAMPLLWAIRDHVGLTGTKYGCGLALCGSCTVLVDGQPVRSCQQPAGGVEGRPITTIEGLDSRAGKAVQAAWERLDVVQCGYCQSGQILAATALLTRNPQPSDAEINEAMSGNICRCATYVRIRAAIREAARAVS